MTAQNQSRPARVCAPKEHGAGVLERLGRPDWELNFDVLELDRDQLALLEATKLWDDINARCGTHIDLYEEAEVAAADLGRLLECVDRARSASAELTEEAGTLLERLRALAGAAQQRAVPVLFLF